MDPELTRSVPPLLTASTGLDALIHCIEAYANRFAHPLIDLYALEGIRRISGSLKQAVTCGDDLDARSNVALGSLYGGLCLGPVNTAAVHALAYPLGGAFHVPHGVANALMLPHVMKFNLSAAPVRYAAIAHALGVAHGSSAVETARQGLGRVRQLCRDCHLPTKLSEIGVPRDAIGRMAESAMSITRLLKNNVRDLTLEDAKNIYECAW